MPVSQVFVSNYDYTFVFSVPLVRLAFLPNLFPSQILIARYVRNEHEVGKVFLFRYILRTRVVIFEPARLCHSAPYAPYIQRYRKRPPFATFF